MTTLALALHVSLPSEIDTFSSWFYDNFDGGLEEHAGRTTLRVYLDTNFDLLDAAKQFVVRLREAAVTIDGVDLDLVNATDIADRTGVTRQYVAQLVAGTAGPGGFPRPVGTAGRSRIWDWGSVNEWLRQIDKAEDETYLSFREACQLEAWLPTAADVVMTVNSRIVQLAKSFASSHEIKSLDADILVAFPDTVIPMVVKHTHSSMRTALGNWHAVSSMATAASLGDEAEAWLQTNGS